MASGEVGGGIRVLVIGSPRLAAGSGRLCFRYWTVLLVFCEHLYKFKRQQTLCGMNLNVL